MPSKKYYPGNDHDEADIFGNNAAFLCHVENCGKVFYNKYNVNERWVEDMS